MICLRCGYCCKNLWVVIVDEPAKGPVEDNLISHEGRGIACKHLSGESPGEYACTLHQKPWYPDTPCARHGQTEQSPDTPCRMGKYILKEPLLEREKEKMDLRNLESVKVGDVLILEVPQSRKRELCTIARTTRTQLICVNTRYDRKTGKRIGQQSRWFRAWVRLPRDGEIEEVQDETQKIKLVGCILSACERNKLKERSLAELEKILAACAVRANQRKRSEL